MSNQIKRPYPDNWPWGAPHKHPEEDTPPPFEGFNVEVPEEGTVMSNLAHSVREAKMALNSVVSVPAVFACDVEDGDIVIPLPCEDSCNVNCDELLKTLRDLGQIPDAIWIPAFRTSTDAQISALSAVDPTTYDPPFYGVAYTGIKRVMVGPVVAHPRFKFHTGDKVYADKNGDLTTTPNDTMVGVCLAPGAIYLSQYASSLKAAMQDLYDNALSDTIAKIEKDGLNGNNIKVTVDGSTTTRTLAARFGDVINVKDFGAKGDGVTNDTAAFTAAVTRAQQLGSNVCLFIPVGTYLVTTLPDVPCYGPGSVKYGDYTYSPFELLFRLSGAIQRDSNGRFKVDLSKMSIDDLAALIKQLLPEDGGGLTTDEDGKLILDFSQMTKEQLQDLINQIIQDGGGLSVDENGQLYVDFASMPTDKFEAMLKSIRVPIWVSITKSFYVDPVNGSDNIVVGIGEEPSKAFATIKACLSYVTENYNINSGHVSVVLADGTYNENDIFLGEFSRTTGYIEIISSNNNYESVINASTSDAAFIATGGRWYLRGLKINKSFTHPNDGIEHYVSALSAENGAVILDGCDISFSYVGSAPTSGKAYLRCLAAYDSGELTISATIKARNRLVVDKGNATSLEVLHAERGGSIRLLGNNDAIDYSKIQAYGTFTYFAVAYNGTLIAVGGFTFLAYFEVPSDQTATGIRYNAFKRGIIDVASRGPTYFPGNSDGLVEESTYSLYL